MEVKKQSGILKRIAGPVVTAINLDAHMYDVVKVGNEELMGEVIKIDGENIIIQVYEDTSGIKPGEPVTNTGLSLAVELGPGLLTSIYDGIQRPLEVLVDKMGNFIERGVTAPGLDRSKKWEFTPVVKAGDRVEPGQVIGEVQETNKMHRIMIPPNAKGGVVKSISPGSFTVEETVITLEDGSQYPMMQVWPVRVPRPVAEKKNPKIPLNTGQRILDGLFPIAKGGTAAIPGPFGSGKTVTQQQLAKWSDAEIVVYIGCGERGNEMTEVLTEFPHLDDPKTGKPLMERTVLIANTSNMPVAAREASVYTGITIAEYFRDMGYDVSLMADSTSRWAEAMREISSRLEEMPGEEGYPAYLAARLSEFYERAGLVETLAGGAGSVTVIGAVSPPGGDFSEPVTQNTLRIVKVFWALDAKLSQRRHFPAINWLNSYSLYLDQLHDYYDENISPEWNKLRSWAMEVLQKESELQEIVQLVGSDALPESEQITIEVARMLREIFLQQNAYDDVDTYCDMTKQFDIMKAIKVYAELAYAAQVAGVAPQQIISIKAKSDLPQTKFTRDYKPMLEQIHKDMESEFTALRAGA
ncbi:V/A-type H+-transporting ATPase subunit A [Methanocalculus alkaliphilus]|uniref:ATP synthase subunit A n=1 Tax=Methanocalculus alkaliphilus TaxID=768730 RepID=UPI00209DF638|nr:V/A-type H+-transporting ATPase subunit A [Methanocalculus alkaliphilus]